MKLPKEWEFRKLGTVVSKQKYAMVDGPFGSNLKSEHYKTSGIPVLQSGFVTSGKFLANAYVYVDKELFEQQRRSAAKGGDLLMAKIGAQAGKCAIIPPDHPESIIAGNCLKLSFDEDQNSTEFFNMILAYNYDKNGLCEIKTETAQPAISLKSLKDYKVPVPPLPEQNKIAQILSTWDQAISATQKLLENSQQQKKALMQQLLAGKKRLFDTNGMRFHTAWEKKKLRELGDIVGGLTYTPEDVTDSSGNLVLRSSNIQNGRLVFEDNVYVNCELTDKTRTKLNDILICVRNGSRSLIGKSALLKGQSVGCFHGAFMTIFRTKEPLFVFQIMQSDLFFREVNKNLGATINSINGSDLRNFSFLIPSAKEERDAIASVLSTADLEIDTLHIKLDCLKQEKKALMQQLLTGKKRVKVAT